MTGLRACLMLFGLLAGAVTARAAGTAAPPPAAAEPPRLWAMGFGLVPPRPQVAAAVRAIDLIGQRAEIAAIHEELPWKDLLAGMDADAILDRDKAGLVKYVRSKGLKLYVMADPTDGLSRGQEAPQLRALGRSLGEPSVQQAYRRYVAAFARRFRPEYIGVAAETNLVRQMASPALYAAVRRVARDTAEDLRAAGNAAQLVVSVQVDAAWGRLASGGRYAGIEQDLADFPFADVLGLSAYPYLASYPTPEEVPDDYFSRLLAGRRLPVMVVEGGWTSSSAGPVRSSPALQARYFARLAQLADSVRAQAVIQLVFADIDLGSFPGPHPAILPLFTRIGVVDADFRPKPALAEWDRLFRRRLLR
ncbi:MAG TPA: hypothetical protein VF816_05805 [Rhodocyclaceae bacterium]